jgi:hypothetical protein
MKNLLSSLKLNKENFLSYHELVNLKGGVKACDEATCFKCVNTASGGSSNSGGSCGYSCGCVECSCWSGCVQNVSQSCFNNFSDYNFGCYCDSPPQS